MENEEIKKEENLNEKKQEESKKTKKETKETFIPAYEKKNEPKKKKEKKKIKINKKLLVIILALLLLIGAVVGIYLYVNRIDYSKYTQYEEKMNTYVFNKLYDNGLATTEETVTKSEAIKVIIGVLLNTSDISRFAFDEEEPYTNSIWIKYAKDKGIIGQDEITKENLDDKATYGDIITYFVTAKTVLLDIDLDTSTTPTYKNIKKLETGLRDSLADLVSTGILENSKEKIKVNNKACKGMLNELAVKIAEKYSTMTVNGEKININPEKIPSNASEYPYTLATVDKTIYEYPFFTQTGGTTSANPIKIYSFKKEYYSAIGDIVESYYNTILNIDYTTIDATKFKKSIEKNSVYTLSTEEANKYVEYVKQNKIVTKGSASAQFPVVYFDGINYRVRTKIDIEVISSDTNKNLFIFDEDSGKTITYNGSKFSIYVDSKMLMGTQFETLYFCNENFATSILSSDSNISAE